MGFLDDIFDGGDGGFDDARRGVDQNRALYDNIALPEYDEFVPELLKNESEKYQTITEDPLLKSRQLELLNDLAGLKENGLSAVDEAGFAEARDMGEQMARAGTQSAIEDAQRRGVGGSGMEFAMREIANQGGAQRGAEAARNKAAEAARQRALYAQAYGDELSGQREADLRTNSANTDIINSFNSRNTQARNSTNNNNAMLKNDAFQYNQGLKDKNFQNQLGKADRQAGLNNQMTDIALAENEAKRRKNGALTGSIGAGIGAATGGSKGAGIGYAIGRGIGG